MCKCACMYIVLITNRMDFGYQNQFGFLKTTCDLAVGIVCMSVCVCVSELVM